MINYTKEQIVAHVRKRLQEAEKLTYISDQGYWSKVAEIEWYKALLKYLDEPS